MSLGLRTGKGFDIKLIQGLPDKEEVIASLQKTGHIIVKDDRIIPTRKGFLVSDRLPLSFIK